MRRATQVPGYVQLLTLGDPPIYSSLLFDNNPNVSGISNLYFAARTRAWNEREL